VAVTGPDGVAATRLRVGSEGDTVVVTAAVVRQEALGVRFTARATAPATLAALAPTAFAPGDTVTLRGARFNPAPSGNAVFFGAARGRIVQTSGDSLLRAVVPPCVAGGTVQVQVRLGTATTNVLAGLATDATRALALRALEATTVSGTEAGNCLRLPGDGARYLLIPQFASAGDSTPAQRAFTLGADTGATALPRSHRGGSATGRAVVAPSGRVPGVRERFERMLRATESRLAREGIAEDVARASALAAADRAPGAPLAAQAPDPPALGSERTFRVLTRFDGSAFGNTTARLRYAGDHILLYEDRAAPAPMDDATVRRMGELFDRTLYPIDVRAFGVESDVDGNGRVIVLMTPLVNALTQSASCASEGFVPGFFYGIDLGTRNQNSNRAEIFYSFVPDPQGTRSCPHSMQEVLRLLPATFLHEFQHMISFNQHVLVRRGSEEDVWLNEGLSHLAEELGAQHYDVRFPAPTGRVASTQLLPDSAVPFIRGNIENALLYLAAPTASSVTTFRGFGTLEERGAAWLFVRWLVAQRGEGVVPRLVQTSRTSRRNVEEVMGEPFAALFADFAMAVVVDSVPGVARARIPARHRFEGRALRELLTRGLGRNARWPLTARPLPVNGGPATGTMVQGTFDLFELAAPRVGSVALRFGPPSGGTFPANAEAQLGVFRLPTP
jgi:hypothetical protein